MDYLFKKLTENIKSHSNVIIMTHKHPDLDGMGSAIGLSKIVESFKKDCYIVFPDEEVNVSLKKGINALNDNNINVNFKVAKDVLKLVNDDTLLIILDTQKPSMVECYELLDLIRDIIVIDHHTNSLEHVDNTMFEYINPGMSSVVEIITGYIKYLNKTIDPVIITLMAAGMEIDTNGYSVHTMENTFKMAGFLSRSGLDLTLKKDILKETMEDVMERYEYIKKSYFIRDGYLLCDMGDKIHDISKLAILANELLTFDGVDVSFVVGKINDNCYSVSARSTEKVDVSEIMTKLGGGGHVNAAAAQFTDKTSDEIIKMIKETVGE